MNFVLERNNNYTFKCNIRFDFFISIIDISYLKKKNPLNLTKKIDKMCNVLEMSNL